MSHKHLFSRFAAASEAAGRLHFAAHSHHWWPDVTREAQLAAWDLAAEHVDGKWGPLFGEWIPRFQAQVAATLGLPDPSSLALAPNTHEFLLRLHSAVERDGPARVLTSDGEFHSLRRQLARWEEAGQAVATRVPVEPFESFDERFLAAAAEPGWDLVYVSQVFFDSGFVFERFAELAEVCAPEALVVIDGYHGFRAIPTDLSAVAGRLFYLSGGYKYAMAGEGCCFLHCPPGVAPRPVDTGWFAGFGDLRQRSEGQVGYAEDGSRFLGATFDPTAVLRACAVFDLLEREGLDVAAVLGHVRGLQGRFLDGLGSGLGPLTPAALLPPLEGGFQRGHFLTFRGDWAQALHDRLAAADVVTDVRGDRLRFGFALYHDPADVDALLERLAGLLG